MMLFLRVAALTLVLPFGVTATAEQVDWADLLDQAAQTYEDPYLDLAYDQLEDLRTYAVEDARLEDAGLSDEERAISTTTRDAARNRLTAADIDADWLIDQRWVVADRREKAATAINPQMDGETVTLMGFAIPAPPAEDGTSVVYLVPERGMCSHMPPPNPNQMIRARVSGTWSPMRIHEPVRLTGKLQATETQHAFRVVDGNVPMRSSFIMDVQEVETMQDLYSQMPTANAWAENLADALRARGQLEPKQGDTTR
ncbi:MAG: hypothetical protein Rhims3KO_35600 [Hyphomicrobiales bacterium]